MRPAPARQRSRQTTRRGPGATGRTGAMGGSGAMRRPGRGWSGVGTRFWTAATGRRASSAYRGQRSGQPRPWRVRSCGGMAEFEAGGRRLVLHPLRRRAAPATTVSARTLPSVFEFETWVTLAVARWRRLVLGHIRKRLRAGRPRRGQDPGRLFVGRRKWAGDRPGEMPSLRPHGKTAITDRIPAHFAFPPEGCAWAGNSPAMPARRTGRHVT
jgi:hypothetical protein